MQKQKIIGELNSGWIILNEEQKPKMIVMRPKKTRRTIID
jgi:hypothetical protein